MQALNRPQTSNSVILGVAGLIATALLAYWPVWAALHRPHGYLVGCLALWMLYDARHRVGAASARTHPMGLLLLVPCGIAAVLAWRSGVEELQLVMLPVLILMAVFAAFGLAVTRLVALPVGFMWFAVPAWNILLGPPMQALTAWVTKLLVPLMGLPASFHGYTVDFQNGISFVVTPACGGVSFLVQGLAIVTLLGELEQASLARRLKLLGAMMLVALMSNWIRVLLIIKLGYATDMRSSLATTDHVAFGYALFVLALVLFVTIASRHDVARVPADALRWPVSVPWRPDRAYAAILVVLALVPALLVVVGSRTGYGYLAGDRRDAQRESWAIEFAEAAR